MSRVNHKRVKQLLNEKRSKITDRQFFTSRILTGHYEDLAAAQTRRYHYNRRIRVNLFWNAKNPSAACTDNNSILINVGHPTVTKVLDESGSMWSRDRCTYARAAAIILYDFCQSLDIPVMVYGHSTGYKDGGNTVELYLLPLR